MCTFLSTLPKKTKMNGTAKKKNLVITLKPCPDTETEKKWYQFRLLNFASQNGSDRDYPFIARYVHQHWGIHEKGYPIVEDEVICPVTKFVDWSGDRYDCPICKYANQQFGALKESNWKDADARKKNREYSRKFQGIIPVYVKNDPNYDGNNGKFKVIIFNDKKFYDEFVKKVEKQLLKCNCFNGVNAVDCLMHVSMVEQINNEGQPNEYRWKQKMIDKITFLKPEKAYDIPQISKENVDNMLPFDDEFYHGSTLDEINAFYNKYIKVSVSNDDIAIDDEDEVQVYEKPTVSKSSNVENTTKIESDTTINDDDLDSLIDDSDISDVSESKSVETQKTINIDDELDILDDIEID